MSNPLKAGLWTALWAFLGSFLPALLMFTSAVAQWADSNGANAFPKFSVLGYAAVSALVAAVSGLISFVVRAAQAKNLIPGNGPVYNPVPQVVAAPRDDQGRFVPHKDQ